MPKPFWEGKFGTSLTGILDEYIKPEITRTQGVRSRTEEAFLGQITDPDQYLKSAQTSAEALGRELFKPGGQVATLLSQARGGTIAKGFAPESGEGAERGILRGATEQIANRYAQGATTLEQGRLGALAGAYGQQQQSIMQLLSALFTGQASIESGKAAQSDKGLFGLGIGPF